MGHPELQIEKMAENTRAVLWLVSNAHTLADLNPGIWAYIENTITNLAKTGEPIIRSTFDVYLRENMLIYVKEPCGAEDVQGTFFLHVVPADASDLPERRKQHSFDNLDFRFKHYGFRSAELCVAVRALPDYDFAAIGTGQFVVNEDGSYTSLWRGGIRFDE